MNRDLELVLLLSITHIIAGGLMIWIWWRVMDSERNSGNTRGNGGHGDDQTKSPSPTSPAGGLPLPDAERSGIRLRGNGRLGQLAKTSKAKRQQHQQPKRRTPLKR